MVSQIFFAPRLWLMTGYFPGSFQWDRAQTFLLQCEQPFRTDIEPAMRWRLAAPLIAHTLGLRNTAAFIIPWAGVVLLLGYIARLLMQRTTDWAVIFAGTLTVATTSAVLVPIHWLGMNDAWVWLGLLVISFSPHRTALAVVVLTIPWVDERFLIGLPLALTVRFLHQQNLLRLSDAWLALLLMIYPIIRIAFGGNPLTGEVEQSFLQENLRACIPRIGLAPLAWWMGLRAAWIPIGVAFWYANPRHRLRMGSVFLATAGISFVLASDMSRSSAIVLPVILWGVIKLIEAPLDSARRWMIGMAVLSVLLPAMHVVALKLDPIENLGIELIRLWRS